MDHVAILNPKLKLLPKILAHQKTIESRWYVHKIPPWNKIFPGDRLFFKDAGKPITVTAVVQKVNQYELKSPKDGVEIAKQYLDQLQFTQQGLTDTNWLINKKYAILVFLTDVNCISPLFINKKGYGNACAWITVPSIQQLLLTP